MSLVERALKKFHETRAPESEPAAQPTTEGSVVETSEWSSDRVEPPRKKVIVSRTDLRAAGVIPPAAHERVSAEQYRHIKRALIRNISGRSEVQIEHPRLIMMTSALSGDGKTFTSVNLAMSLASERDRNCLLVDGDVAKPHVDNLFGVQDEPGLLDALQDDSLDVESLVLPTDVPGLSILPAGQRREGTTELLASERMHLILQRLEGRDPRRVVLFDSPPILLSSEARILLNVMGQIVFVVRSGVTPKAAVLEALGQIDDSHFVGLILNQSETQPSGGYYGYGYGYGAESNAANKK